MVVPLEQADYTFHSCHAKPGEFYRSAMRPAKYCGQRIRIHDTISVPIGIQEMVARGLWNWKISGCLLAQGSASAWI
jgi:hypothetical protein